MFRVISQVSRQSTMYEFSLAGVSCALSVGSKSAPSQAGSMMPITRVFARKVAILSRFVSCLVLSSLCPVLSTLGTMG